MRGIFISYRRDDAEGQAGRLFDDLSAHFGRDAVFMDVAGIKKGLDFRRIIDAHVASCGVLLVIIGKRWLPATDSKGKRRLDDANDFVRLETAAALSRDIPVVPVLVQDAIMPTAQELPDALKELAFRNGTELTHARWDSDVKLLIEDLKPYLETTATAASASKPRDDQPSVATARRTPSDNERRLLRRPLWAAGAAALVAGGVSIFGYQLLQDRSAAQSPLVVAQAPSAAGTQPPPAHTAAPPLVVATPSPRVADEPAKLDPVVAQAEAAKAVAARAAAARAASEAAAARAASARAAAAKRDADEARKREEVERSAQWAEEKRKRDEEARRVAQEQAEKQRIAAEQAAAARMFTDIATAILGSRQNNRR